MRLYKIRDWDQIYETNRTRELKEMSWLALPTNLNSNGYIYIATKKNNAAIFGAFVSILEVAAHCKPRGTLIMSCGIPHDALSLSGQTRIPVIIISEMLEVCSSRLCNWLIYEEITESAEIPHQSRTFNGDFPHDSAEPVMSCNVMSGCVGSGDVLGANLPKKDRMHSFDKSPYYEFSAFRAALPEWSEEKCLDYYERAKGYSQANGGKYLNWVAAVKNWDRKSDKKKSKNVSNESIQKNIMDVELK